MRADSPRSLRQGSRVGWTGWWASWLALAAVGAGIVHLALAWAAVGHLVGRPSVAGGALTGVLILVGVAELSWGMVALIINRPFVPDSARWAALAPVAGWALALTGGALVGDLALPFLPMGYCDRVRLGHRRRPQRATAHRAGSSIAHIRKRQCLDAPRLRAWPHCGGTGEFRPCRSRAHRDHVLEGPGPGHPDNDPRTRVTLE